MDYDPGTAAAYAGHRRAHPGVLAELLAAAAKAARILEIGCGTGNYLAPLARSVSVPACGVDPSPSMLAAAAGRPSPASLLRGEGLRLPVRSAAVDLAYSVDVIHHVGDPPAYFREVFRVLRDGGTACTATDSPWMIRNREPLSVYFPETVAVELVRYPSIEDLREGMRAAGFTGVRESSVESRSFLEGAGAFEARAFSSLRFIDEQAYRAGLERLHRALAAGPVPVVSRYLLLWGRR